MTGVRVLVGTRKGAFILTSDGKREQWDISGPHFAGWEVYHLAGSPADPDRVYASQSSGWFGQLFQRSEDGGKTWSQVGSDFCYQGEPGSHLWYDGTPRPFEFKRIWHIEPSADDPDMVYAGGEDAAFFRSGDGGQSWEELPALRTHESAPSWQPGAGGMCLHTIVLDPVQPSRIFTAISAAGVFRSDDAGKSWRPANRGLRSGGIPDEDAEVGHCVHKLARHPSRPDVLFMQKHWDVMRSDDAGGSWQEISGDLPTDFGFAIDVHAHEPETVYVVPITSDSLHLRTIAQVHGEVQVDVTGQVTQRAVLDALEARYPMLRGTIRDRDGGRRRAFIRFFACEQDLSNDLPDAPLPEPVAAGTEPFMVVGAMAGG
jgi:hypothetical protein